MLLRLDWSTGAGGIGCETRDSSRNISLFYFFYDTHKSNRNSQKSTVAKILFRAIILREKLSLKTEL